MFVYSCVLGIHTNTSWTSLFSHNNVYKNNKIGTKGWFSQVKFDAFKHLILLHCWQETVIMTLTTHTHTHTKEIVILTVYRFLDRWFGLCTCCVCACVCVSGPRLASRLRMFLSDIWSRTATGGMRAMVAGRRVTSAFMSLSSSSNCFSTERERERDNELYSLAA